MKFTFTNFGSHLHPITLVEADSKNFKSFYLYNFDSVIKLILMNKNGYNYFKKFTRVQLAYIKKAVINHRQLSEKRKCKFK